MNAEKDFYPTDDDPWSTETGTAKASMLTKMVTRIAALRVRFGLYSTVECDWCGNVYSDMSPELYSRLYGECGPFCGGCFERHPLIKKAHPEPEDDELREFAAAHKAGNPNWRDAFRDRHAAECNSGDHQWGRDGWCLFCDVEPEPIRRQQLRLVKDQGGDAA